MFLRQHLKIFIHHLAILRRHRLVAGGEHLLLILQNREPRRQFRFEAAQRIAAAE